jgi:CRP-like cAMP-binding protein
MTIRKDVYSKHVKTIPAGKIIFSEGDPAQEMFIIIQGEVEISKRTSMETSKTLIVLKQGDIFGEMAIIEAKPRSATAIAATDARVLSLDESLFFSMIEKNADFASKVVRILSERIRRANSIIQALSSSNRESIVFAGVKDFSLAHGIESIKGKRVNREKFVLWATHHIGLSEKEIGESIARLVSRDAIVLGSTPGELILPQPR